MLLNLVSSLELTTNKILETAKILKSSAGLSKMPRYSQASSRLLFGKVSTNIFSRKFGGLKCLFISHWSKKMTKCKVKSSGLLRSDATCFQGRDPSNPAAQLCKRGQKTKTNTYSKNLSNYPFIKVFFRL